MMNNFLENIENQLDSGWYPAFYFLAAISFVLLIAGIVYIVTIKYRIRYFVDEELVYFVYYKKGKPIEQYTYQEITQWYKDPECSVLFTQTTMPDRNLKLYAKTQNTKEEDK